MIWENEFTGARAESEDPPGPGWVEVPDPDVILSLNERETLAVKKILELLTSSLASVRESYEVSKIPTSIEAIALQACADQAKIRLLKEILRRLGE